MLEKINHVSGTHTSVKVEKKGLTTSDSNPGFNTYLRRFPPSLNLPVPSFQSIRTKISLFEHLNVK